MKRLILLAALVCVALAETCTQPKDDKCDETILKCCDSNFQTALMIDCKGKETFQNPDCVERVFDNLYFNGTDGALAFCRAFNDMRACLGSTTLSCTSFEHYLRSGFPLAQAQTDEAIYGRMFFQCGAGLDSYLRNAAATVDVFRRNGEAFNLCGFKFRNNVRHNPSKGCDYLQEYASCVQLLFDSLPEMSWFMCETVRAYGNPFVGHCDLSCSTQ